jgi:hypothetical protein
MKKIVLFLFAHLVVLGVFAQTNVSGGIFANTSWTLAGSPYIVTGSVVVFPGYTLTIEPGVTVKFDAQLYLEIRQSTLIAEGTSVAPIVFTSNSLTPVPGIWGHANYGGVWLNGATSLSKINHCTISYSTTGLYGSNVIPYLKNSSFRYNSQYGSKYTSSISTDSCTFSFNQFGIGGTTAPQLNYCVISNNTFGVEDPANVTMTNCRIDSNGVGLGGAAGLGTANLKMYNCTLSYNQKGLSVNGPGPISIIKNCLISYNNPLGIAFAAGSDSLIDCEIRFNEVGVYTHHTSNAAYITRNIFENNNVGIQVNTVTPHIYCNRICNNTFAGLEMITSYNVSVANNYWCTSDSSSTTSVIYDAYDDATRGIASFLPLDSTCAPISTALDEISVKNYSFTIYPNPSHNTFTISLGKLNIEDGILNIYDVIGRAVHQQTLTNQSMIIDKQFSAGIYFVKVQAGEKVFAEKLVVE